MWIGEWNNMNRLCQAGLKDELAGEVLREAETIIGQLPEKDRTNFAAMYALDEAARRALERRGVK
jgi:hypothetical protein